MKVPIFKRLIPSVFKKYIFFSNNYFKEKKSSSFNEKKRFKSRSDRPKSFTFKKYSQKRTKA